MRHEDCRRPDRLVAGRVRTRHCEGIGAEVQSEQGEGSIIRMTTEEKAVMAKRLLISSPLISIPSIFIVID